MGNAYNDGYIASEIRQSTRERSNTSSSRQSQASKLEGSSEQYAQVGKSQCKGLEGQWINSRQSKVSQSGDAGSLAYPQNGWDVWRDRFMGTPEQEHYQRGSQTNGSREWWQAEPNVGRVADGVAARVDRLKAIGNGQVPLCAATAWRLLSDT
jgi:DNA (cytosine-5)-methyltransferase 1